MSSLSERQTRPLRLWRVRECILVPFWNNLGLNFLLSAHDFIEGVHLDSATTVLLAAWYNQTYYVHLSVNGRDSPSRWRRYLQESWDGSAFAFLKSWWRIKSKCCHSGSHCRKKWNKQERELFLRSLPSGGWHCSKLDHRLKYKMQDYKSYER